MAAEAELATLIVDDEPLGVERLQILCAKLPGVRLVGSAADGHAALRLVEALKPDLVLCDISMPDMDGIAVARALQAMPQRPQIVFVTAFDQFAVSAFDVEAADYLLKPVAPDRLSTAIARARARIHATGAPQEGGWLTEIWVPHRSEVVRIDVDFIERIEAERDYMRLCLADRSYLVHTTITELERRLDPAKFMRLHRSTIVRRDRIERLRHDGAGGWFAELKGGVEVRIGRSYAAAAREMAQAGR
jgi:two-component system response regulator AlgR